MKWALLSFILLKILTYRSTILPHWVSWMTHYGSQIACGTWLHCGITQKMAGADSQVHKKLYKKAKTKRSKMKNKNNKQMARHNYDSSSFCAAYEVAIFHFCAKLLWNKRNIKFMLTHARTHTTMCHTVQQQLQLAQARQLPLGVIKTFLCAHASICCSCFFVFYKHFFSFSLHNSCTAHI